MDLDWLRLAVLLLLPAAVAWFIRRPGRGRGSADSHGSPPVA